LPSSFRPIGVAQTVAFHAGKFAGTLVSGNGKDGERGNGNS
jgi:hypothetical protein